MKPCRGEHLLKIMQNNASSTLAEATLPEEHPRRSQRKEH
jgi:hypothetical protein